MANYSINVNGKNFAVYGYEAAWIAYRKACDFAELVDGKVALVDNTTGEVIEDNFDD